MKWIWQLPNWPEFTVDLTRFTYVEREFHRNAGVIVGSLSAVSADEVNELRVTLLSNEAVDTSKIEGEILDRDSVQSSIRKQLGLQTDGRRAGPKETGAAQMIVDLVRSYQEPLAHQHLFSWHKMTMNSRTDLDMIGGYRTYPDPMQIVSGRLDKPRVFYEAPPSERLVYFSQKILEAQIYVQQMIAFVIYKARYFDIYRAQLNDRQTKVALRLFHEGLTGFSGGLSAENYIRIAKTSRATATRNLAEMVELGALMKQGKLRHTRYYLPADDKLSAEKPHE